MDSSESIPATILYSNKSLYDYHNSSFKIYKTTNLINGTIYIGQTKRTTHSYIGSGYALKRAIKKYGKENFKRNNLQYCGNKQEADILEKYWIAFFRKSPGWQLYNIADGGQGGFIIENSPNRAELIERIRCGARKNKGKKRTEEVKKRFSERMKNFKHSEETKAKMSLTRKKYFQSKEVKEKHCATQKIVQNKPETVKKRSESMLLWWEKKRNERI